MAGAALLGDRALGAAELQRGQPVAVHDGIGVRRVGVLAGTHDQPGLAVRIDALANELDAGLQDEVAGHPLPDEVELVALRPHVGAASRQRVVLRDGVVGGGAGDLRRADVAVRVEVADGGRLGDDGDDRRRANQNSGAPDRGQRVLLHGRGIMSDPAWLPASAGRLREAIHRLATGHSLPAEAGSHEPDRAASPRAASPRPYRYPSNTRGSTSVTHGNAAISASPISRAIRYGT